jgi:hypothetical protein
VVNCKVLAVDATVLPLMLMLFPLPFKVLATKLLKSLRDCNNVLLTLLIESAPVPAVKSRVEIRTLPDGAESVAIALSLTVSNVVNANETSAPVRVAAPVTLNRSKFATSDPTYTYNVYIQHTMAQESVTYNNKYKMRELHLFVCLSVN